MTVQINAGSVIHIPLEQIRPFANQPRKDFDPKQLQELAGAISVVGQQVSAIVIALPEGGQHRFELVDGERRWRACKLAGVETLKCEIVETSGEADQYRRSVASNFGRADHTPLEIADAIKVLRADGMTIEKIADLFGRSVPWVCNYQSLQKLSDSVLKLLNHPEKDKRLRVSHAFAIASLPKSEQIKVARDCVSQSMRPYQLSQRVRSTKVQLGIARPEDRDSHDDWMVIVRFVDRTLGDLQPLMDIDENWILRILSNRNERQLDNLDVLAEELASEMTAYTEFIRTLIKKARNQGRRKETA
ncbi:ParB/RepB/Spo0J family partition protein [Gimesia alba]|uniref:ParB/RepB/Spo0J family partition protein n=1 Tax=Gimesia alba TaxID=2527973 RepID=UPI0018D9C32D|nr:ParB/RepB/Spo0J family partition protein [Gimesia alba]